ncbi:Exostosin family protein [Trichomonas vaginalis G3]|uniref:Exostosin family protein n=1 Tax=Trichomonas vaginalis (strain ATCC PRA-98 / G3) TaxID=412133 RepID=A2DCF9_TRIV3|nr:exostosin heparan sulfate glycosyltransferase -related family [Trichomonas vaginalis G3]EAY21896.1 Exostosin family protein [Trichomonas vaginalis G3]KAI5487628.1 exostosin heparan sulfate glycosyltransferase -related family [Trichomonas vaginalis G3]|eukprot:XP_001582882.1 Exostosin family protein [Trichomonas vaginalis G3]
MNSKVYTSRPEEADLFLVPIPLSGLNHKQFADLHFLLQEKHKKYYSRYNGCDHIFIHGIPPKNQTTAVTYQEIATLTPHFLTPNYVVMGDHMNTWRLAKNVILPLEPQTKYIKTNKTKKFQIAFDADTTNCTDYNKNLRDLIRREIQRNKHVVVAKTHKDMLKLIEQSYFSVVTPCEDDVAHNFYDAINSLSIPIVYSDRMRFPFEDELIDYSGIILHFPEQYPKEILNVLPQMKKHTGEMIKEIISARKLFQIHKENGGYAWALSWSLYMKFLAWLPIRRNRVLDDNLQNPLAYDAM